MNRAYYFLFLNIFFSNACAFSNDKIISVAANQWSPYVDNQNQEDGLSLAIIRSAFATKGYTVKMEYVPWVRAEIGVTEGRHDILPDVWITEERKLLFDFSDEYAVSVIRFIKRKGDGFEFSGLESLRGKKIGTLDGYGYNDAFLDYEDAKKDPTSSLISNLKKLIIGRIDLTLEDEIVAKSEIQKDSVLLDGVELTEGILCKNPLYIAASLKNPRHEEIIKAFNEGLKEIKKNGKYGKIVKSYGVSYEQ